MKAHPLYTVLLVGLITGCSKQPGKQANGTEKPQLSVVSESAVTQTPEPTSPPTEPIIAKAPTPAPTGRELEQAAKAMGLPNDQAFAVLQRQDVLWTNFKTMLRSDNASQVVPMLLAMSEAVRGTPNTQADGQRLPESFLKMLGYENASVPGLELDSPEAKTAKAGFMGVNAEKLPEQQVLAAGARELAKVRPDLVTSLAQERAKALPPTAADYILFNAIIDGLAESPFMESTGNDSEKPKTLPHGGELLTLADAPNPIYRLLAVRTARYAEREKTKLIDFYSRFVNEPDPFIREAAEQSLKQLTEG